ncbi:MAG TPA: TspO/MBR family protein [Patescibacteria group bacterium]|nr:TspO/MBR family protein [Patescibacteria group bacterium]
MKLNASHAIIPLSVVLVAVAGSYFTTGGMEWSRTIRLPAWTPPGQVIGAVWTTIFALAAASAIIAWNGAKKEARFGIGVAFALNGVLNVLWSALFFGAHLMSAATAEAALLELSVLGIIALVWQTSRLAAVLLFPYAGWVAFATYLTFRVWTMNL